MRSGIRRDELLFPSLGSAILIVGFQRRRVVCSLVAEDGSELLATLLVPKESVPVIVADLVTKMAEDRSVRLTERQPPSLAFCIIRFC